MPKIVNFSLNDIETGNYPSSPHVLIQIADWDVSSLPTPKYASIETHQFCFLDCGEEGIEEFGEEFCFSAKQAEEISEILRFCLRKNIDVFVHCVAGISRSGAITEAGTIMGFDDTGKHRIPNSFVKSKILSALGLIFDPHESPFNV